MYYTCIAREDHIERLVYRMEAPTATGDIEYRLTRLGDRTRLDQQVTIRLKGLMRVIGPFIMGMIRKKMMSRLALLRDVIERNGAPTM